MAGKTDVKQIEEDRDITSCSYNKSSHKYGIQPAKENLSPVYTHEINIDKGVYMGNICKNAIGRIVESNI